MQGEPYDAAIDTGTVFITNQRVIFSGNHQTRECDFARLINFQNDESEGSTTLSVSNRQKATTIHYGHDAAPAFQFRLSLALAYFKGTVSNLQAQLEDTLTELEEDKPKKPEPGAQQAQPLVTTKQKHYKVWWVVGVVIVLIIIVAIASSGNKAPTSQPIVRATNNDKPTALVFSGAINSTSGQSINVKPATTSTSFDSVNIPVASTQCVISKGNDGLWTSDTTFKVNNTTWTIELAGVAGNPSPGKHTVQDIDSGTHGMTVDVIANPKIEYNNPDGNFYYMPMDKNNGVGLVTINPDLQSGTIDVWEVLNATDSEIHITGTWNCAK